MPITNPYTQSYRCTQNNPLGCQNNQDTIEKVPSAKFCLECGFSTPLSAQVELRGILGTYRISELLRPQGIGRIYRGTQLGNGQLVAVKEYLLPNRCFNATESHQRRTALLQITQGNLNNQKDWEFRSVSPLEVIADPSSDRIYLIFPGQIAAAPTLAQVVKEKGAFTATQVRVVLNQILQTLHFLHSQNLGTAHGNLGLDSLLMSPNNYVYACDRAALEQHFIPGSTKMPKMPSPSQDLIDLGWVAFFLWTGQAIPAFDAMLDAREAQHWPQDDPPLKDFVHRLLGLDAPFESAAEARQTLLELPLAQNINEFKVDGSLDPENKPSRKYWLLSLLALPILALLLWFLLPRSLPNTHADSKFKRLLPSFADVNNIQPGQYPYTGESLGTWSTVLDKQPISDRKVRELLTQPKADVAAMFNYRGYSPQKSPLDEVLTANGKANFAIASLVTQLPQEGLVYERVAYDGLLVYVPAYKSQNLPSALQGKISVAQLKQIFTGQIVNWQKLDPDLPDLPIKLYRPIEPEAIRLFEEKILNNDPRAIAQFRKIESRSTSNTLRSIATEDRQSQKTEAGTISFGLLAQTWDQCKVYPLALTQGNAPPVQPRQKKTTDGSLQPISPGDNLCLEKKPFIDISAFSTAKYPLSGSVVVAYPLDNNLPGHGSGPLFAQFLKTQDGQYLLQQAGIVPLQPIPKNHLLSPSIFNR